MSVDPDDLLPSHLTQPQEEIIAYFCDAVRILGLPRSIGEIYGLLFISAEPLSIDELVTRLGISKGSASQGLKFLRNLGAVHRTETDRKAYFSPELQLKSLVGGFISEEVHPHLRSGEDKLARIHSLIQEEEDPEQLRFYQERFHKMERWTKQAKVVLPLLKHVLKS